jgi:hypothetical protein
VNRPTGLAFYVVTQFIPLEYCGTCGLVIAASHRRMHIEDHRKADLLAQRLQLVETEVDPLRCPGCHMPVHQVDGRWATDTSHGGAALFTDPWYCPASGTGHKAPG